MQHFVLRLSVQVWGLGFRVFGSGFRCSFPVG